MELLWIRKKIYMEFLLDSYGMSIEFLGTSSKQKSWIQHTEICQTRFLTIYSPYVHNPIIFLCFFCNSYEILYYFRKNKKEILWKSLKFPKISCKNIIDIP